MRIENATLASYRSLQADRPCLLPNERRGWLTAILSAAPVISSAVTSVPNAKDPERFAKNREAYNLAIVGNIDALNYLKYMSGRFGASNCGAYGACSGWATQVAKDDAFKLYTQATQVLQGQLPQGAPVPTTPATTTPAPVTVSATYGGSTATSGATVQIGAAPPPTPEQQQQRMYLYLLLGAAGIAALVFFMRKRG